MNVDALVKFELDEEGAEEFVPALIEADAPMLDDEFIEAEEERPPCDGPY